MTRHVLELIEMHLKTSLGDCKRKVKNKLGKHNSYLKGRKDSN